MSGDRGLAPEGNRSSYFAIKDNAKLDVPMAPTSLEPSDDRRVEAWFLGPKAENLELFERLVVEAVRDHGYWRRSYKPGDPGHITSAMRQSSSFQDAVDRLETGHRELLAWLKKSVPWFSMRYQGHMNWEVLLPGMLGYFSTMLYNPNNVAFEGSTATTILELLVGDDLCRMLGYAIDEEAEVRPWGHITCDGTVANIEALWSARNLKFYPHALAAAMKDIEGEARFRVLLPTGEEKPLAALDAWELSNLDADEVLGMPARIASEGILSPMALAGALRTYGLQELGLAGFSRLFLKDIGDPAILVPGTKHYSFPKAAALLGLGSANLIDVAVDKDGRMDISDLEDKVRRLSGARRPIIAAVAVMGTTEESALDPLTELLALRERLRSEGVTFHVHADAAWGGYHRSLLNPPYEIGKPAAAFAAEPPPAPYATLSDYAEKHLRALGQADSITVDPHKGGYVPYPAGALCYRNGAMRNLVTFSAPVVFHGEAEPTVGIYGIEGSKPGAAPAAVYLAHRVVRPDVTGYGTIISRALYSCRKLYVRLLAMAEDDRSFIVVPLPRLPSERSGSDAEAIKAELRSIIDLLDRKPWADIRADAASMAHLKEIGPDENILSYAFNLRNADGSVNSDPDLANALNQMIYQHLSIRPGDDVHGYNLVVSTTDIMRENYGDAFVDELSRRLGLRDGAEKLSVIRSVVMDPWVVEAGDTSFVDIIETELRRAVLASIDALRPKMTGL